MTSKKFMTATGANRELQISRSNEDDVQIRQYDPEFKLHRSKTFFLNQSDAPALALAILEAAGWPEEAQTSVTHTIMADLRAVIATQERATAEAKERAELEAEALELINAYRASFLHCAPEDGFEGFDDPEAVKSKWLAVARRAREMRAEK